MTLSRCIPGRPARCLRISVDGKEFNALECRCARPQVRACWQMCSRRASGAVEDARNYRRSKHK